MWDRRDVIIGAAGAVGALVMGCASGGNARRSGATSPTSPLSPTQPSTPHGEDGGVQDLSYGDDASQFAELLVPRNAAGPVPVAVIIHGGFWRAQYELSLGRPLATTLPERGWAALNIEYRRVGNGGGYPATLEDVGAAIDAVAGLASDLAAADGVELDTRRVVTIGHSAGGQLAAWAATRSGAAVAVAGVVSQAGVLDLRRAALDGLGAGATQEFLGGGPGDVVEPYDVASPIEHLPLGVPTLCVHGRDDAIVPISQSEAFVAAATRAGDAAELVAVDGDHFVVIDPLDVAWTAVLDWLDVTFG